MRKKSPKSVLYNHQQEMHPDVEMQMSDFVMNLEGSYRLPIQRQSREGVNLSRIIKARDMGIDINVLNSKMEFMQPGVIKPSYAPVLEGK